MPKPASAKNQLSAAFSAVAEVYEEAAFIEHQLGLRLLERIHDYKINPLRILDLGCATGYFTQQLQSMFPEAKLTGIDLALEMVKFANRKSVPNSEFICADAEILPFANQSFDLVWANCCFNPSSNLNIMVQEINRVLSHDGIFCFTTFGPNTLQELGLDTAWLDMHIIGDLLVREQFKNPVVDQEQLTINYSSLNKLLNDLQQSGSYALDLSQNIDLSQPFAASFEVIYGLAHGQVKSTQFSKDGKTYIPLPSINFKTSFTA